MYPTNLLFSNCVKGPAQGGLPVAELKELAKKMGINPKLTKAEICNEMAKILNNSTPLTYDTLDTSAKTASNSPSLATQAKPSIPSIPVKPTIPVKPSIPSIPVKPSVQVKPSVPVKAVSPVPAVSQVAAVSQDRAQQLDMEMQGNGIVKALKSTDAQGLVNAIAYHINKYDKLPPYFSSVMKNYLGAPYYKNIDSLRVKLGLLEAIVKSGKSEKYLALIAISYPIERPWELPMNDYIYYYNVVNNLIDWAAQNNSKELSEKIKSEFGVSHIFVNAAINRDLKTMKEVMKLYPPTEKDFIEALNQVALKTIMDKERNDFLTLILNMVKPDYLVKSMAPMNPVDYVLILELMDPKLAEDIILSLFMYFAEHNQGTKRENMNEPVSLDNLTDILSLYNYTGKIFLNSDRLKKGVDAARNLADKNGFSDVKKSFDFIQMTEEKFKQKQRETRDKRHKREPSFTSDKCNDCVEYFKEAGLLTNNQNAKLTADEKKGLNNAFKRWAVLNHPDKGGDNEKFAKISGCRDYYNDGVC